MANAGWEIDYAKSSASKHLSVLDVVVHDAKGSYTQDRINHGYFLWRGDNQMGKIHLVRWSLLARLI